MSDKVTGVTQQKGVPSWGRKRGLGPSTCQVRFLLGSSSPKRVFKCQFLYVLKYFGKVGLSQLLRVDWLLAWSVLSSQAGASPMEWASWYAQGSQIFKQPLGVWPPSRPGDYLIYSGGLSPCSSVW